MFYRILADTVVLIHFLWILFLIFGAVLGRRVRAVKILHISGLAFAFIIEVFNFYCPLTYIEVWARSRHDPAMTYSASFIVHYLEMMIYIEIPRYIAASLTIFLCGFNAWLYTRKDASKLKYLFRP